MERAIVKKRFKVGLEVEVLEAREVPATFTVTTTATTGPGSLDEAIAMANAAPGPDVINFGVTGTILARFQNGSLYPTPSAAGYDITSDLTIQGPGADFLSIQGDPISFGPLAFWVESGARATISGLSIQNMKPSALGVGAITNFGNLTLDRVVVSNVTGTGGAAGGVYTTGTLTVANSTFRDNLADFFLPFSDQRPLGGGAILMRGGSVAATDSLFQRNSAYWSGGAINASLVSGSLTIDRCTFTGNSAATDTFHVKAQDPLNFAGGRIGGGAVYAEKNTVTITNSTFNGNSTGGAGGAIQLASGSTALITNVTVAGNSAQAGMGATIADVSGGGIGLGAAPAPVLRNTIVAGNILGAPSSPNTPDDYTGGIGPGSVNNLIGANPAGPVGNGQNGNMVGTPSAPIDPLLGALGDNGGLTPTMMPQAGSPAIDRGSNGAAAGLSTDQRGGNFVRVFNGTVDIGAVEVQTAPPPPPPVAGPGVILVGGAADGTATVLNQSSGVYAVAGPVTLFPGFAGDVRTAAADVNGDEVPDYIGGSGPGGGPRVAVIDGATGARLADFFAFEPSFTGGVFVAAGDFDSNGRAEIVVTPDQGGGPRVSMFSLNPDGSLSIRANFFGIADPNFRGGARTGAGDVNNDGVADLAVAAGFQGGPRIAVFDGRTLFATPARVVNDFFAFEDSLRNGAYVAIGDGDGDGFGDFFFGAGPGGAPRLLAISGLDLLTAGPVAAIADPLANFFVAGNAADRGGVRVATKNADGDNRADLVVGSGEGSPANARVYLGKNFASNAEPALFQDLAVFGGAVLSDGVFVG
jgi:hypothetical protein